MPNNLTDAEIKKALECCCEKNCKQCPAFTVEDIECSEKTIKSALDLINRQKAEIERLQDYNENLQTANTHLSNTLLDEVKTAKAEAVKEFAERLKKKRFCFGVLRGEELGSRCVVDVSDIDNIAEEMVGDSE